MARPMSRTRELILQYLKDHIDDKGYPPTVREIAWAVGIASTSTVHRHLEGLEKDGYIRRSGSPRAIELVGESDDAVEELLKSTEGVVLTIRYKGRKYALAAGEG